MKALETEGYTEPTPIQEQSIPDVLRGKDLLGCAQTGTGKTAAFAIPILQNLILQQNEDGHNNNIKALILTPTRELAIQIDESFEAYGKHTGIQHAVIYGGVSQYHQTNQLRRGRRYTNCHTRQIIGSDCPKIREPENHKNVCVRRSRSNA